MVKCETLKYKMIVKDYGVRRTKRGRVGEREKKKENLSSEILEFILKQRKS